MKFVIFSLVFFLFYLQPSLNYLAQTEIDSSIQFTRLNINNISTVFGNNGLSDYNYDNIKGFRYPKEFSNCGFWWTGFLLSGKVENEIRVSGTTYYSSLMPYGNGMIYRVRKDYRNGNFSSEISDGEGTEDEIRVKYEDDWNNWPANEGAPYQDINKNGIYEPDIDIPGVPGADQTIWLKTTDNLGSEVINEFGSKPLGIEIEFTYWAYNKNTPLNNTIFRRYKVINKSVSPIEELYYSIFSDPDIGDAGDDYVGCDTLLNLAFAYNASNFDAIYKEMPPTFGISLIKGPYNDSTKKGLSSFNFIINSDPNYGFPEKNSYENGALRFYNLSRGIRADGLQYQIPERFGGGETTFPFSGDPIRREGWIEGKEFPPGNRNFGLSTGPLNLLPNEFHEIVFAQIAAGGINGINRLQSLDSLKIYTLKVKEFYTTSFDTLTHFGSNDDKIENDFILYQNYPNPFNSSTVINYSLSESANVQINIFDLLGRKVVTLVDDYKNAGIHSLMLNENHYPSGVYFYTLTFKNKILYKKMMLLK
ncbi:MAG: T9SS type A sorting domain-containing protein [Melioribacteraceae bacterium]|nr:T9SS type A sorting domain-containing protein [Melioribacteraceae bacterium]